jgi:hypothetical protein
MLRVIIQRGLAGVAAGLKASSLLILLAWAVRGCRPIFTCGAISRFLAADWTKVYGCLDRADYEALHALVVVILSALAAIAGLLARKQAAAGQGAAPRPLGDQDAASDLGRMQRAIQRAYSRAELRVLVHACLHEDFDALVADKTYAEQIYDLLLWCDRRGLLAELFTGLSRERPRSRELADLRARIWR